MEETTTLEAPPAQEASEAPKILRRVHVSCIVPNPWQPREEFKHSELESLAQSIKEDGLWYSPMVREHPSEVDVYQLADGERRTRAITLLHDRGQHDGYVTCLVREMSDLQMAQSAVKANLEREDLNAIEEGQGYANCEKLGMTQTEIGKKFSKDQSTVSNRIRLLRLPDAVKDAIKSGNLSTSHGIALLALKTSELQGKWALRAMGEQIAVKTLEGMIRDFNVAEEAASAPTLPGIEATPVTTPLEDPNVSVPPVQNRLVTEVSDQDLAFVKGETDQDDDEATDDDSESDQTDEESEATTEDADTSDSEDAEAINTEPASTTPVATTPPPVPAPGTMVGALIPTDEAAFLKSKGLTAGVALANFRCFYQICEGHETLNGVLERGGIGDVLEAMQMLLSK